MSITWKTYRVEPGMGGWEPASYNIRTADGREYSRWRRVLRQHPHGLTVISHYKAPPGKAWRIVGKAPELGEEFYILEGAYYDSEATLWLDPEHSCLTLQVHDMAASPAI
jgi:hypothetical protein